LAKDAIAKAEAAKVHPLDFLLAMVADEDLAMTERVKAAQAVLPYVASRITISEINVTHEIDSLSDEEIVQRLESVSQQLLDAKPPGKLINGSAVRMEAKQEV